MLTNQLEYEVDKLLNLFRGVSITKKEADTLIRKVKDVVETCVDLTSEVDKVLGFDKRESNSHGEPYKFPGCVETVPPHWDTGLQATTEICHRPLPCPVHKNIAEYKKGWNEALDFVIEKIIKPIFDKGSEGIVEALKNVRLENLRKL